MYVEVHESGSNLKDSRGIVSSRALLVSDLQKILGKVVAPAKVVNAAMRSLCANSNTNYSLAEMEKFLLTPTFDELLDS